MTKTNTCSSLNWGRSNILYNISSDIPTVNTYVDDYKHVIEEKDKEINKLISDFNNLKCKYEEVEKMRKFTITDIKIPNPNKVVIVEFSDGTKEKAVCHDDDIFSLETGISICVMKKMMGGNKEYNKFMISALKLYENKIANQQAEAEEAERKERKYQKEVARKKRRKERKIAEQIKIQKEAFLQAMKEFASN